jgi:hypothetical protein
LKGSSLRTFSGMVTCHLEVMVETMPLMSKVYFRY